MKNNNKKKIRIKLLMPLLLILVFSLIIISVTTLYQQIIIINNLIKNTANNKLDEIILKIEKTEESKKTLKESIEKNYIRLAKAVAEILYKDKSVLKTKNMIKLAKYIGIDEIHISDDKGNLRWSNIVEFIDNFNYNDGDQSRPFLNAIKNKNFEFAQEAMPRVIDKKLFQYTGVSRKDAPGIVQIGMHPKELQDLLEKSDLANEIKNQKIGINGYIMILNKMGKIIAHTDEAMLGKDLNDIYYGEKILSLKNKYINVTINKDRYFVAVKEYINENSNIDMILTVFLPKKEYFKPLIVIGITLLITIILVLIISFFVIYITTSKSIINPIYKMVKIIQNVAKGDLTENINLKTNDEFEDISDNLNLLILKFRHLLKNIKNSSSILADTIQNLNVTSKEISTTSNQQAASVKQIVSTMEDADRLSKDVVTKIDEVARISNQSKNFVEKGVAFIKRNLLQMNEIKNTNSNSIKGIKELSEKINNIWDIVNIINNIADQTKIIAFNAELEASAAGEAGKNFQIVAGEIRRLANNTVNSTKKIKEKINEIQHSSDNLIIASEEGTKKIKDGWIISAHLKKIFIKIINSSEISAKSAGQIATSVNQQASAFEQILLTLKQISAGIEYFVSSTKSTTETTEVINKMAYDLNKIFSNYSIEEKKTNDNAI